VVERAVRREGKILSSVASAGIFLILVFVMESILRGSFSVASSSSLCLRACPSAKNRLRHAISRSPEQPGEWVSA